VSGDARFARFFLALPRPSHPIQRYDFSPISSGRSNGQHPLSLDTLLSKGTRLARALTMSVFEAKMVYSLVSLGEEVQLDTPSKVADYLRSAFDENPMQEAFYCVYLDRKNHPLGRDLITLGTATSILVSPKEVFREAIVVAHNHSSGEPLCITR
jgi:DNA repair protein RadC